MYKVLTLNKISPIGTDCLNKDKYEILNECDSPDGILLRSFDMHDYELPKSLLAIGRAGAGTNNIPSAKCSEKGIVVFNTPGANANAVKELVICGLLLSSRKVVQGINWANSLKGQTGVAATVEKGKGEFVGPEIMGKKLGVIGLGAIGMLVANAACALGMQVVGYDPHLSEEKAKKLSKDVKVVADLDEIVTTSDYISLHVPLLDATKYMFNDEMFNKVKKSLKLLNFSRGELVCNDAVKKAIKDGKVSSYVIDFPTEEIIDVDGIIPIPHLGASSPESEENCAYMAAMQLKDYIEFGNIKNSVNFANCELEYTGKKRICVLTKGEALKKLDNVLVSKFANSQKGEFGYSIFDIDEEVVDISAIEAIEGVIKVRVI